MTAQTEHSPRFASRLGHPNRRLAAQNGRRLPNRLHNGFERLRDVDPIAGLVAIRGSLFEVAIPERS